MIWLALWWSTSCEEPLRARLVAWLAEAPDLAICLERREQAGITPDGVVHLPVDGSLGSLAARAAHLAAHRHDGALTPPGADCPAWLRAQRAREAAAEAIEARFLRLYRARPLPREDVLSAYQSRCTP